MPCTRQPLPEPAPGVYPKMPEAEYHQREAVNASMLKSCGSPLEMHEWRSTEDEGSTGAMRFGTLIDAMLTVPEKFENRVVVEATPGAITKTWNKHQDQHPGKVLSCPEWEDVAIPKIRKRLADLPDVRRLLGMEGPQSGFKLIGRQLPLFWENARTRLLCKCLLDLIGVENDRVQIVQIKTTRDTEDGAFGRQCLELQYDIQAAQEFEGVKSLAKQLRVNPTQIDYWFLAIGNSAPFDVVAYKAPEEFIELGQKRRDPKLAAYAQAYSTDRWVGFGGASGCAGLDVPEWALKRWAVGVG